MKQVQPIHSPQSSTMCSPASESPSRFSHLLSRGFLFLAGIFALFSSISFAAEPNWEAMLANNPNNQMARHAMGKKLNVKPELVQTKLLANNLLKNIQATFAVEKDFFSLIACFEEMGEYENARKYLTSYISYNPQKIKPVLAMAYDYYLQKNYDQAIAWYKKASKINPSDLDCYHGQMLSLMALKDYDNALRIGKSILVASPANYFAALRMGNILYERKAYLKAWNYYSLHPENIDCQLGMGLCYFHLKDLPHATPLLKAAVVHYPANSELLAALKEINSIEIANLQKQLSSAKDLTSFQYSGPANRLAELYEINGEYEKAVELLLKIASKPPQFKELLRIAADYSSAGKHQEAGNTYLTAINQSPDPWTTSLAALDSFLLAKKPGQAQSILLELNKKKPVIELWPYFGKMYSQMNKKDLAKKYFEPIGLNAEQVAKTLDDPRENYLYAIDCYLDAVNYSRAKMLLDYVNSFAPGIDLDRKFVRYYFELKNHTKVVEICSKHPDDPLLQNSRGWSYIYLGKMQNAEITFRNVLRKYPDNLAAKAGLDYADKNRLWEFFLGYTRMSYDAYQDARDLVTESIRYNFRKTTVTVSHTCTDVDSANNAPTDFGEDLYGGKITYQSNEFLGFQLHGMNFQNNDGNTNGSSVAGGKIYYTPNAYWLLGFGYDSSSYNTYNGSVFSPFAGYQFSRYIRADIKGLFSSSGGKNMRASQEENLSAGMLKATFTPVDRLLFSLGGFFGERRLNVEGDSLYAFNTLDRYKSGYFARFLFNMNNRWKLFLSFSHDNFESEWQALANEKAGAMLFDPDQSSNTFTAGTMFNL
ncbi:MAG: tetratricopeptide repeat protein [Candidatus Riflebacteria bacterium]|nr:tetratricopeptide repeat protein [Candidatus Riflebacteria bacterium]